MNRFEITAGLRDQKLDSHAIMADKLPSKFHSPTRLVRSEKPIARREFNLPRTSGRESVSSPAVGMFPNFEFNFLYHKQELFFLNGKKCF